MSLASPAGKQPSSKGFSEFMSIFKKPKDPQDGSPRLYRAESIDRSIKPQIYKTHVVSLCGLLSVVYCPWSTVRGLLSVVYCPWSTVRGLLSVVYCPWSTVCGLLSVVYFMHLLMRWIECSCTNHLFSHHLTNHPLSPHHPSHLFPIISPSIPSVLTSSHHPSPQSSHRLTIHLSSIISPSIVSTPSSLVQDAHSGSVGAVSFSPTGTYMATGGFDNTVKVWDATSLDSE